MPSDPQVETTPVSLSLLVCQSESVVAVRLHKFGEGPGGLTVSQKWLSNNPAVFIITLPLILLGVYGQLNLESLRIVVTCFVLLLSFSYYWVRIQLSQICQVIYHSFSCFLTSKTVVFVSFPNTQSMWVYAFFKKTNTAYWAFRRQQKPISALIDHIYLETLKKLIKTNSIL